MLLYFTDEINSTFVFFNSTHIYVKIHKNHYAKLDIRQYSNANSFEHLAITKNIKYEYFYIL